MSNTISTILVTASFLFTISAARADETTCIAGLEKAAGKYASCQSKAKVKSLIDASAAQLAFAKCRAKYAGAWARLTIKNPGTSCSDPRFEDNGDGTVTDNLTGLVWEKKATLAGSGANPSDRHDVDNTYTWTTEDGDETDGDGTAFTDFLADLNSGGGFAGTNDWRLPTISELQTILPAAYPCEASPCVDPVFGPTVANGYWSATTSATTPTSGRFVHFGTAGVFDGPLKDVLAVRAVRAGL